MKFADMVKALSFKEADTLVHRTFNVLPPRMGDSEIRGKCNTPAKRARGLVFPVG
jgi:hypothetical protein